MTEFNDSDKLELCISNYLSGDATTEESKKLFCFLNSNQEAMLLYQQMAALRAVASMPAFASEEEANLLLLKKRIQPVASTPLHRHSSIWLKIAAMALIIFASNFFWYQYTNSLKEVYTNQQTYYEIKVPAGSRTGVELPDGTEVTLNAGSVLRYYRSFGISDRQVELRGEGYFKVAKNRTTPFFVNTDDVQVEVLGTVFNVSAYDDENDVTVSLIEGRVDLNVADRVKSVQLFPNERAVYNKMTKGMSKHPTNALKSIEWTESILVFENEPSIEIAKRLEREYDVKIIIRSDRLLQEHFSGSFDARRSINDILNEMDVESRYIRRFENDTIFIDNK